MKKMLAILLAIILVFSTCAVAFAKDDNGYNEYPVVLIPGYSATNLVEIETGERVWGLGDSIGDMVMDNLNSVLYSVGLLGFGNTDKISTLVGDAILELCEKIKCNPDGTSKYNLTRELTRAEDTQYSTLMEKYPEGDFQFEGDICKEIANRIGYENIFVFTSDFRMNSENCAKMLDDYIKSVREFTGKKKVNLFAVSHGGQTAATYFALYGHQNHIANAVLTVPAIGGVYLAYDPVMGNIRLDEECLVRFLEFGFRVEEEYDWIVKAQQLGILDEVLNKLVPYLLEIIGYWNSIWDFIPVEKYEEAKAYRLDKKENAAIIKNSDRFHYEILPKVGQAMRKANRNGANISIIAGHGIPVVSGYKVNSDALVSTNSSTGATCAPWGEKFANGYTQINPCDGKYKVSPDMTVDASTAYLPDNTWFVNGLFHGMTFWDFYSRELMMTLLCTSRIKDVYTDPEYPQFHDSTSPALNVYAEFENCKPGYIDSNATTLKVKNTCWKTSVKLNSITINGIDLRFKVNNFKWLKPGETITVEFTGDIPKVSKKQVDLTICYTMPSLMPLCYRTQGFTIMNGNPIKYTGGTVKNNVSTLNSIIGENATDFLKTLGLNEFFSMLYEIYRYWITPISKLINQK